MLIGRTKEQVITTTLDTYMDVIGAYKQKIKEANKRIAYLEGIIDLGTWDDTVATEWADLGKSTP